VLPDNNSFRHVLGHFCSGVVIVTSRLGDQPIGLTAQSFSSLSLDPPLVLFCPANSSTTWPNVRESGHFCVNVLGEHQEDLCRQFAVSGGDKFAGLDLIWSDRGNPLITGSLAQIECELRQVHPAGDHQIAVGLVHDVRIGDPAHPLLFFKGAYRRLVPLTESLATAR
jgi:3-hydroxy-9,10-secoandrosta-1,3,5(10)-triene-9,17-dione monooxygenase reductase component